MIRIPSILLKIAGSLLLIVLMTSTLLAQKPEVRAIDKTTGSTGEVVIIQGSSFGTVPTDLAVTFGARRGTIQSVSNQQIEVLVPPGATFDNISVTNLTSGLIGYTAKQFLLSFSGEHPFSTTNLSAQQDFNSEKGLGDVHLCDLDNDGKVDAVTANEGSNSISLFRNTSVVGTISFTKTTFSVASSTLSVNCDDLNGDGLQDIVLVDKLVLDRIFILKNNGGFSFTSQEIKLTGRKNQIAEIADLDMDGKPEILVTDNLIDAGRPATIAILNNTSTLGAISFAAAPILIPIPGKTSDDIVAEDVNGDGLPEIITSQYTTSVPNGVYIILNQSSPGSISFGAATDLPTGNRTVKHIKVGDLDGDGKPDLAVTHLFEKSVSFYRNTGSGNTVGFAPLINITTELGPWGMDFGDLDGNGKTDVILAHANVGKLTILDNQSTTGTISFVNQTVNTTYTNRHVKIGDLDGDGKPDVAFTSVDPNASTLVSKVSVLRNRSCVVPRLTPENTPLTLCANLLPYRLQSTISPGANYEWLKDGTLLPAANNGVDKNSLNVTTTLGAGEYTVRIVGEGGTCSKLSTAIKINIGSAGDATNPGPYSNSPICEGSTLELKLTTPISGATYKWTGPNDFTSTLANPTLPNFKLENAGTYVVEVTDGTSNCVSSRNSTVVQIVDIPTFAIAGPPEVVFCQGTITLTVVPAPNTFTYQWYKDGAAFGSSSTSGTSPTITAAATSTGNYTVKPSNAGCSSAIIETDPVHVKFATPPTAIFSTDPTPQACAGQKVKFNSTSVTDNSTTTYYKWYFGDTQTSTEVSPEHIYSSANTYSTMLEVSYANGVCLSQATGSITITSATVPQIINTEDAGVFSFCDGEDITLGVSGSNITSYSWSTGANTPTITVTEEDTYSVDILSNGCTLSAVKNVTETAAPIILVTATPEQINEGETSQLSASGINNYSWTPTESIESGDGTANPIVKPIVTTTYTVTGDDGTCQGSASIQVKVIGEAIVSKLAPTNFFSPNESPPNDTWVVDKITDYPQCGITIYDDKGVKVFDAKPYNNDWDGTYNGKKLPDGTYFYIIRCEGEENKPRTGAITLLR